MHQIHQQELFQWLGYVSMTSLMDLKKRSIFTSKQEVELKTNNSRRKQMITPA